MPLRAECRSWLGLIVVGLTAVACGPKVAPTSPVEGMARATPNHVQAQQNLETATGALDVSTRRFALVSLMRVDNTPGGGPWAAQGLWDPEASVQRGIIDALDLRLPEEQSQQTLREYVQREGLDPYARCAAASALARVGDQSTLSAVQAAMADASAPWVAAPCALAAAQMGDDEALQQLQTILSDGELPLDIGFMDDVGRSGLAVLSGSLQSGLSMMEEELELAVATALLQLGDPQGESMLRRALHGEAVVHALEAVDFLLDAPTELAVPVLNRAGGGDVGVAARLARIAHGDEPPYFAVESLLSSDREVRALACLALGRWLLNADDPPRRAVRIAREGLLQGVLDLEEQVRLEALRALASAGTASDAELVAPLVMDSVSDWQTVVASATMLQLINPPAEPSPPQR